MKKTLLLLITAACIFAFGCGTTKSSQKADTGKDDITNVILEQFEKLTQIPRPSHHEEKISAYLKAWAEKNGFKVEQDKAMNIIADVPATKGWENKPMVGLQGHMDMVFAQADGLNLVSTETKIVSRNDGVMLTSDGRTSLGADDGIGVAIAMCIAEGKMEHGPLRLFFTTDEEDGMTGARNLDPAHFKDLKYLINIDSETAGVATVSSASNITEIFEHKAPSDKIKMDSTVEISLKNLSGGHSGLDINLGRLNGIIALAEILSALDPTKIDFQLCSFEGGFADNAIPTSAHATICINSKDFDKAQKACLDCYDKLKKKHSKSDPNMEFSFVKAASPAKAMSADCRNTLLGFVCKIDNGVYAMSEEIKGLVETSSNLGIIKANPEGFKIIVALRSSNLERENELLKKHGDLASSYKISFKDECVSAPWPVKKDSELIEIAKKEGAKIEAIHAGLECGQFATYNPDLDMISIGPTLKNPHTIKEHLTISTIKENWEFLERVLADIK